MSRLLLGVVLFLSAYVCTHGYRVVEEHTRSDAEGAFSLTHSETDGGWGTSDEDGISEKCLGWMNGAVNMACPIKKFLKDVMKCPPVRVVIGSASFGKTGDTASCPVRPWTPEQTKAREKQAVVSFGVTFIEPPAVFVALQMLDIDKNFNGRWDISVSDITTTGCTINFKIWCNTLVHSSVVGYQATGYVEEE